MKQSNALWPDGICSSAYGDNISTDKHSTEEAAMSVCSALEREGFGGMRQHFPIKTWVSDIQQPPQVPDNIQVNGVAIDKATCIGCGDEFDDYRIVADNQKPDPFPVCNGCISTMEP